MELVNHPKHYNTEGRKECIEEMMCSYGPKVVASFCLLSAYKYLYRAGEKEGNSREQDIAKACWYLDYFETKCVNRVTFSEYQLCAYRDVCRELRRLK